MKLQRLNGREEKPATNNQREGFNSAFSQSLVLFTFQLLYFPLFNYDHQSKGKKPRLLPVLNTESYWGLGSHSDGLLVSLTNSFRIRDNFIDWDGLTLLTILISFISSK